MSSFDDFVNQFDEWKESKNLMIDIHNSCLYGWKMGLNVQKDFKSHLTNEDEGFDAATVKQFQSMFEIGGNMMGVEIISLLKSQNNINKICLYKISEGKDTTTLKDVVFQANKQLFKKKLMKDPLGGYMDWKYAVKIGGLNIRDSKNTYVDAQDVGDFGTFHGDENGVHMWGTINYTTSDVVINRITDKNAKNAFDLEKEYQQILKINPVIFSTSGGSSTGSSTTTTSTTIGKELNKKPISLEKEDFKISYTKFVEPVTIVWEYTLP